MDKIKIANRCALLTTILLYIQAFVFCAFEYLDIFASLGDSRGILFVGLMIFTAFLFIHLLPTGIVAKITTVRLIIIVIATMIVSLVMYSTNIAVFIIELVALSFTFVLAVRRHGKITAKLNRIHVNEFALIEYKVYKYYELNLMNFVLYICFLGAITWSGLSKITVIYAVLTVIVLLILNYVRMFQARMSSGSIIKYLIENVCIIVSFILTFIFDYLEVSKYYNLYLLILVAPYAITTIVLWREYRTYLYK